MLNRSGSKGGTLKIAHDADLELPVTEFSGSAQWLIEAESGSSRPRIRFRPSAFTAKSTSAWSVLFNLRSGFPLHLKGLDLLIPEQDPEAPRDDHQAAIGISAGSELTLNECTITVAGRSSTSAAIVVQPSVADEVASVATAQSRVPSSTFKTASSARQATASASPQAASLTFSSGMP